MYKKAILLILFSIIMIDGYSQLKLEKEKKEFSKAGYFTLDNSGREVFNFNVGWRFYKGDLSEIDGVAPFDVGFDDSCWDIVNTPDGLEALPLEASGGQNYQGEAWYRKRFNYDGNSKDRSVTIYFEAVMGKTTVWVNGVKLKEHYGGYLPFSVDISDVVKSDSENIIVVSTDNSDDPEYPPGKPQGVLDFSYFGGIYRDVYLITTDNSYITDPNETDIVAGGGVAIYFKDISKKKATVGVTVHVANRSSKKVLRDLELLLLNRDGDVVAKREVSTKIGGESSITENVEFTINNPQLWSPDNPYLHRLEIRLDDRNGNTVDGVAKRVGIRSIEFRGRDGFYLNGEPFEDKLMGGNRHQDFALLGNALPNSGQWRDAKKLRDVGLRIVRSAHYPQDPAFMDAADELGLFVIVATPGWQFWNKNPQFEERVVMDIRNMIRRDRNHPSVIMWEPILNETWYPDPFAERVYKTVHEEYPWDGAYAACDDHAKGAKYFDVLYHHPFLDSDGYENCEYDKALFTREWGDNVDDWSSHNSPSRAYRGWGETPQLIQAKHYSLPDYPFSTYNTIYKTPRQHVGGTLWHSYDHQRGYHPDPFYGGILDAYRQPKYSYYMFKSQRDAKLDLSFAESGPMVYIANEMTPFSHKDVTVFSNCDSVRVIIFEKDTMMQQVVRDGGMPSPPLLFKGAYDFMDQKRLHRLKREKECSIVAEGIIDGKVVARAVRMPSKRASSIKLEIDDEGVAFRADGSDVVAVIASVVDQDGVVKRLNNSTIKFEVIGEAEQVANLLEPNGEEHVSWGTAPILVRSTVTPGSITVKASLSISGENTPIAGEITFNSIAADLPSIHTEVKQKSERSVIVESAIDLRKILKDNEKLKQQLNNYRLKEVEQQQTEFERIQK